MKQEWKVTSRPSLQGWNTHFVCAERKTGFSTPTQKLKVEVEDSMEKQPSAIAPLANLPSFSVFTCLCILTQAFPFDDHSCCRRCIKLFFSLTVVLLHIIPDPPPFYACSFMIYYTVSSLILSIRMWITQLHIFIRCHPVPHLCLTYPLHDWLHHSTSFFTDRQDCLHHSKSFIFYFLFFLCNPYWKNLVASEVYVHWGFWNIQNNVISDCEFRVVAIWGNRTIHQPPYWNLVIWHRKWKFI